MLPRTRHRSPIGPVADQATTVAATTTTVGLTNDNPEQIPERLACVTQ